MFVGICKFTLMLGNSTSLKEKRQVVQKLRDRIQNKFNVAVGEVDDLDVHSRVTIGYAIVGSDYKRVDSALKKILDVVNEIHPGSLVDENFHVEQYSHEFHNEMISEKWE